MLLLSRKVGEKLVIAGDIQVTVLAVAGNKVRLGIDAPQGTPVQRAEARPGWANQQSGRRLLEEQEPTPLALLW